MFMHIKGVFTPKSINKNIQIDNLAITLRNLKVYFFKIGHSKTFRKTENIDEHTTCEV